MKFYALSFKGTDNKNLKPITAVEFTDESKAKRHAEVINDTFKKMNEMGMMDEIVDCDVYDTHEYNEIIRHATTRVKLIIDKD